MQQSTTILTPMNHTSSHIPLKITSKTCSQFHYKPQDSHLLDLMTSSVNLTRANLITKHQDSTADHRISDLANHRSQPATNSNSMVDQTAICDISRVFKKVTLSFSNDLQVDRTVMLRLDKLARMQVDVSIDAKLTAKRQVVMRHTLTVVADDVDRGSGSPAVDRGKPDRRGVNDGRPADDGYVYVIVFDRVMFARSHNISYSVFARPVKV